MRRLALLVFNVCYHRQSEGAALCLIIIVTLEAPRAVPAAPTWTASWKPESSSRAMSRRANHNI